MLEELRPEDPAQVGPYRITGVLGTGGMGRVFLGWSSGGRPVAVKVIKPELAADPEFRSRFRREVAAARTISGLYTALLIDADTDGPVPWLATAYVDGPSLTEAVSSYGPLPAGSVRMLAAGLAEALAAVHGAGLVHRDLKPSNVLLASDGPRLIDFGISRAADTATLTNTGQSIGSPGYLSPEQAVGSEVGPPSDIFSLGAVLAFAASGNGPFGAGASHALIYRVVHQPPTLGGVPDELRPLIDRCLAKEPEARPTASELLDDLAGVQPGAQWLPERITAALAAFTAPALASAGAAASDASVAVPADAAVFGRTATSEVAPAGGPPAATPAGGQSRPGGTAAAGGGTRRPAWLRRSVLVPVASAVAVVAALAVVLATTLGGQGGPVRPVAATSFAATSAAHAPSPPVSSPRPGKPATPTHSPSQKAAPKESVTKTATTQAAPIQPAPTVIVVTTTAPPAPQPSSAAPKTSAPVRTIAGTYAFAATVVSCVNFEVCATPMTLTFTCQSSTSCTMTGGAFKSAHAVSVSGNAIDSSGTDTGLTFCSNGAVTDDPYTLDLTVLTWSTGSVSVPTSIRGTYSDSEPGAPGCNPGSSQQTFTYG